MMYLVKTYRNDLGIYDVPLQIPVLKLMFSKYYGNNLKKMYVPEHTFVPQGEYGMDLECTSADFTEMV